MSHIVGLSLAVFENCFEMVGLAVVEFSMVWLRNSRYRDSSTVSVSEQQKVKPRLSDGPLAYDRARLSFLTVEQRGTTISRT